MNIRTLRCVVVAGALVSGWLSTQLAEAQVTLNGGRVNEMFDYTAPSFPAPLDGLGGVPATPSHSNFAIENWHSTGGDPVVPMGTGDPFVVRGVDIDFGPEIALPDPAAIHRSIGRTPQANVGIAHRKIGNGTNTNTQNAIIGNAGNHFRESWSRVDFSWTGGKAAFALAGEQFRADAFDPRIQHDGTGGEFGMGFHIENTGILKASAWEFSGITQDDPVGIQLAQNTVYRAYLQIKTTNAGEDEVNVYVLSHSQMFDNGDPLTGNPKLVYLFDDALKSSHAEDVNNASMRDNLMLSLHGSGGFNVDGVSIGWLNGTDTTNFAEAGARDAARQALIADRSPGQLLAWKNSLGSPYVTGDVRLDGALGSEDIDTLREQINRGNTKTFYDLNSDTAVSAGDVDYLVQTIFNTNYGDVDLDGDIDSIDQAVVQANLNTPKTRWADGDLTGDGMVDAADLAFFSSLTLPGDFNDDNMVDAADYTQWRDNVGSATEAVINNAGNGTGGVDSGDYTVWVNNFDPISPAVIAASAVPEPAGLLLAALAGLGLAAFRWQS